MSLYDWIDRVTVVTTIPFWGLGFGVTIHQLIKTKDAARAAQESAERALSEVTGRHSLVVLPMLHKIESDLELAIDNQDKRLVTYQLSLWRWQAGQLRQSLDLTQADHKKLAKLIQSSITQSAEAKMELSDNPPSTLDATRKVRKAISDVTGELGALAWGGVVNMNGVSNGGR